MSNIKDGGQAFPSGEQWRDVAGNLNSKGALHGGMTLRDYFAAKAMQGLLSADSELNLDEYGIAKYAYLQADAMLAQRESNQ